MSGQAFDAWNKQKHLDSFWDLNCLVTVDQRARIRPIYVSHQQLKQVPLGGWSLRSRIQDAAKAAKERALAMQPHELEQELRAQKYAAVAEHVIERIKFILNDKGPFHTPSKGVSKEENGCETTQDGCL